MNWYKKAQQFYRGTVPGEKKRIDEPFDAAMGLTFMARKPESARNYGESIETITANPGAKILYSESPEFWRLIKRRRPPNNFIGSALKSGESVRDAINDAINKAREAGYDALSFEQDADIGTIIFNENAFERVNNELV